MEYNISDTLFLSNSHNEKIFVKFLVVNGEIHFKSRQAVKMLITTAGAETMITLFVFIMNISN